MGRMMEAMREYIEGIARATRGQLSSPAGIGWRVVLLLGLVGSSSAEGPGAIHRFTDERGVTHFSNVGSSDPRFLPRELLPESRRPLRAPRRADYDRLIEEVAAEQALLPALLKAVVAAESGFDPRAVSPAGAQGLMQLMPETAARLGVDNPMVPGQNVRGGARYLRALLDRYGDLTRALAAYNAGPEAVDRYGGLPPYRETRDYVERVLTYYRSYHGDFAR